MNIEKRIFQYRKALKFYKKNPSGRSNLWSGISFYCICDIILRNDSGDKFIHSAKDFPELLAMKPSGNPFIWWSTTPEGVKTRVKKLELMIKMAQKRKKTKTIELKQ